MELGVLGQRAARLRMSAIDETSVRTNLRALASGLFGGVMDDRKTGIKGVRMRKYLSILR
jgi:hypothetical protein